MQDFDGFTDRNCFQKLMIMHGQPLKVRVRESAGWGRGAEVRAQIDPARVLVFAAESQK